MNPTILCCFKNNELRDVAPSTFGDISVACRLCIHVVAVAVVVVVAAVVVAVAVVVIIQKLLSCLNSRKPKLKGALKQKGSGVL